jgi:hypothetical protein
LNWIRAATLGTLKGDIGLKVQIGLAADLGFKVSGKHAVVLSRGMGAEQNKIRLRLYRIGVRDWNLGFSADATAQAVDSLLPANFDDLIAGALGVSGTKIVAALKDVDAWTDPSQPLFGPLGAFLSSISRASSDRSQDLISTPNCPRLRPSSNHLHRFGTTCRRRQPSYCGPIFRTPKR